METADQYWDKFYKNQTIESTPSNFLKTMGHRLSKGKCLEIGIGTGANSIQLAKMGFDVKGIEISNVAIEKAKQNIQKSEVNVDIQKSDLDLFIFGLMEYDSLVAIDFRPSITRYYSEFIRSLKQGGTILIDCLTIDEMTEAIGDDEAYRNYYYKHNELLKHLKGMRILYYHEGLIEGKNRVQLLAQKYIDKDAAKYNLFGIQSVKSEDPEKNKQRELAEALFKKK